MRGVLVACVLVGVVGAGGGVGVANDGAKGACLLLTADDISNATGAKAGEAHESETVLTSGPQQGGTMTTCMWKLGDSGMFHINVIPAAKGAAREAGLAKLRQGIETLKSKGWKEEKKNFGKVTCATLTPPGKQEGMPISVGCMGEAKGMGVGVAAMSPGKAVPLAKVKALFDKATSRLP
jgi:hypothetical protein